MLFIFQMMLLGGDADFAQGGTWTLSPVNPPDQFETAVLPADGTVIIHSADNFPDWYKLTPDAQGNYVDGTLT